MTDRDEVERSPAHEALMNYQQADMDGIMVLVSRQAIHEVDDELRALSTRLAEVTALKDALVGDKILLRSQLAEAEARAADAYEKAAQVADAVFKMRGETPQGYTAESIASDIRALGARRGHQCAALTFGS